MLSPDFLFPRFLVFPPANPSNFSLCKCFSIRLYLQAIARICPGKHQKAWKQESGREPWTLDSAYNYIIMKAPQVLMPRWRHWSYTTWSCSLLASTKWEMIAVMVAKKVLNPQMGVPVCNDCWTYVQLASYVQLCSSFITLAATNS